MWATGQPAGYTEPVTTTNLMPELKPSIIFYVQDILARSQISCQFPLRRAQISVFMKFSHVTCSKIRTRNKNQRWCKAGWIQFYFMVVGVKLRLLKIVGVFEETELNYSNVKQYSYLKIKYCFAYLNSTIIFSSIVKQSLTKLSNIILNSFSYYK